MVLATAPGIFAVILAGVIVLAAVLYVASTLSKTE